MRIVGVLIVAALSAAGLTARPFVSDASVVTRTGSATLHFNAGRRSLSFRLHEPSGVIQLYRLRADGGMKVRGSAQIPRITAPLRIATGPTGPRSPCTNIASRIDCTIGEEGCPMPEATWHFRVDKLAGPAGDVTLWFRIGTRPGQS